MLPPIRYPLPTLLLLIVLAAGAWRGERMTRSVRSSLAAQWHRAVAGPPIPSSSRPQVVAGPIVRKALLLHDDVAVSDSPGGAPTQSIRLRMFVDIYDVWPLQGAPSFYRVGNRHPVGWAKAAELLPWNTRLVVRRSKAGRDPARVSSSPVLAWTDDTVEIARWAEDRPWGELEALEQIPKTQIATQDWGIWISREELLNLLRQFQAQAAPPEGPIRLRALLGRLSDDRPFSDTDLAAARTCLPPEAFSIQGPSRLPEDEVLARINENWKTEASWGGLSFQFLPLNTFPNELKPGVDAPTISGEGLPRR